MSSTALNINILPVRGVSVLPRSDEWILSGKEVGTSKENDVQIEILGPTATPKEILLGSLNHPLLFLRKPIQLQISRDEKFVVVSWPEFEEFGYGNHLTDAIEDFRQTLVEFYLGLESEKNNLGPELKKNWDALQEWIEKR